MSEFKRDHIAASIADYEGMSDTDRGQLLAQILEDQPMLMGFLTNLADDFSDSEHESLVDSSVILVNAFVAVGIPVPTVPDAMIKEVIEEKVAQYEDLVAKGEVNATDMSAISDSPVVLQDLRARALVKSDLNQEGALGQQNFLLILDSVLAMVERSASLTVQQKESE
jgi:hypothetical protein